VTKPTMKPIHYKETDYGFEWGAVKIERIFSDKKSGWVTIGFSTPKYPDHGIQIYTTRTGKVRIFKDDKELK
jgi:hypothetical protein